MMELLVLLTAGFHPVNTTDTFRNIATTKLTTGD